MKRLDNYTNDDWFEDGERIYGLAKVVIGDVPLWNYVMWRSGHPISLFAHPFGQDLSMLPTLLEEHDLQIITVSDNQVYEHPEHGHIPYFGIAPRIHDSSRTIYHVTKRNTLPLIFKDGLLPSNEHTSFHKRPDSYGKLYGSKFADKVEGGGDPATFWIKEFKKIVPEEEYVILKVDLSELPETSRVYRDTHSVWGLIVDRFAVIPTSKLEVIEQTTLASFVT